jgi:hypothetical protein
MKMKLMIRFIMIVLLGAGITACAPKKAEDCGFVQNVYGQRISWKTTAPIQVYVSADVPTALKPAIHRAAASWEQSLGRKVFEVIEENSSQASAPSRDKKNGIYFLSQWESDRKSEQGRTSVYWAGDEIQEADIRINSADFVYYDQNPQQLVRTTTSTKASAGYNFEALILHELGHFLGLKHREAGGTVMAKELAAYTDRVALASADVSAVQCEYK